MSTKLNGDIAEQAFILFALRRGWGVSVPLGDRLPYDVIVDVNGSLVRCQIKRAWLDPGSGNFIVDNRRCKTNRREMIHDIYKPDDFDFAIAYIDELEIFYVFPIAAFCDYAGPIHMVEEERRQRKPRSAEYRKAWGLLTDFAHSKAD